MAPNAALVRPHSPRACLLLSWMHCCHPGSASAAHMLQQDGASLAQCWRLAADLLQAGQQTHVPLRPTAVKGPA